MCAIHADLLTVRHTQRKEGNQDLYTADFQVSDQKMIEQYCRDILMSACAENAQIPAELLRKLRSAVDLTSAAAMETNTQYERALQIPKMNEQKSSFIGKLAGLPRLDLLAVAPDHRDVAQKQVASESDTTADASGTNAFINLSINKAKAAEQSSGGDRPSTFADARKIIERVHEVCLGLYRVANNCADSSDSEAQLATQRLVLLVEHAATRVLPIPKPRESPRDPNPDCLWQKLDGQLSKVDQVRLLGFIFQISQHYVAAGSYLEGSDSKFKRERVSRSTVTLCCLMAIFDALVRHSTEEAGSANADMDALSKALCGESLGTVSPSEGHWMSPASTDGTTLEEMFGWQQLSDPEFLVARSHAYSYLCPEWAQSLPKLFEVTLPDQTRTITVILPHDEEDLGLVRAIQDSKATEESSSKDSKGPEEQEETTEELDPTIIVPLKFKAGTIISVDAKLSSTEWIGSIAAVEEIRDAKDDKKIIQEGQPAQQGSFDPKLVQKVVWQCRSDFKSPSEHTKYLKSVVKPGMALKCNVALLDNDEVQAGSLGEFKQDSEAGIVCSKKHALGQDPRSGHRCDVCGSIGTQYRCTAGCDYDMCSKCFQEKVPLADDGTPRLGQCMLNIWPRGIRPEPIRKPKKPDLNQSQFADTQQEFEERCGIIELWSNPENGIDIKVTRTDSGQIIADCVGDTPWKGGKLSVLTATRDERPNGGVVLDIPDDPQNPHKGEFSADYSRLQWSDGQKCTAIVDAAVATFSVNSLLTISLCSSVA